MHNLKSKRKEKTIRDSRNTSWILQSQRLLFSTYGHTISSNALIKNHNLRGSIQRSFLSLRVQRWKVSRRRIAEKKCKLKSQTPRHQTSTLVASCKLTQTFLQRFSGASSAKSAQQWGPEGALPYTPGQPAGRSWYSHSLQAYKMSPPVNGIYTLTHSHAKPNLPSVVCPAEGFEPSWSDGSVFCEMPVSSQDK